MADQGKKFYVSQLFPPWDKAAKNTRVQLNPRTAVAQSEAKLRIVQLVRLTAVLVVFFGLLAANSIIRKPINIQASFDFKRSIIGTITSVDPATQTFIISLLSSQDTKVVETKNKTWSVQLIPGKSIVSSKAADGACFLIDNLNGDLKSATPADCTAIMIKGKTVLMDYVFLNVPKQSVVVRSIIQKR